MEIYELTPLEREIFEEMVKLNPGTTLSMICGKCNKYKDASYSYWWYYTDPSLTDISPLVRLTPLKSLHIVKNAAFSDLSPLASCPDLEELEVYETGVTDLTPLAGP